VSAIEPSAVCGIRLASGAQCSRPASPKSALGACELHRRRSLFVAWSEGWPMALPLCARMSREEDES